MTNKSAAFHVRVCTFPGTRNLLWRRWVKGKAKRRAVSCKKHRPEPHVAPCVATRAVGASTTPTQTTRQDVTSTKFTQTSILVGDIGGTNARLSLWRISEGKQYTHLFEHWYPTKEFRDGGLQAVLKELCKEEEVMQNYPTSACFAIAGPVANNRAKMTNLGWVIDGEELEQEFGWKVALVNDFEALGYGIPLLDASDLVVLNDVPAQEKAPIAVLGPGTGLGQAQLMWDNGRKSYRVWPSEGAHSDFAPRNDKQRALQQWIAESYGYCELEHVACGAGLERIYTFLKANGQIPASEPPLLTAPEISKQALSGEDVTAVESLDMMLAIVGAEAGHMGLRSLAHGGIFIAGGITPKVIERVKSGVVLDAFLHEDTHRFRPLLKSFRLCAVMNEEAGLIGCRHQATELLYS